MAPVSFDARGVVELRQLLGDLRARARGVAPVEADLRHLLADALRPGEGGQRTRHAVENAATAGAVGRLLRRLDLLPVGDDVARVARLLVAEDVGMPAHQLVHDAADHVVDGEGALASGNFRLENDLEQEVTELLAQVLALAGAAVLDGVDDLAGLLERVLPQALERLLAVPGAAVRGEEATHHADEAVQGAAVLLREGGHRPFGGLVEASEVRSRGRHGVRIACSLAGRCPSRRRPRKLRRRRRYPRPWPCRC